MSAEDNPLNKARRLVDEGRRLVWEQKGLIARRRTAGLDVVEAEQILRVLERNLRTLVQHKDALESEDNQGTRR